jgi:hypothetical protein
MGVKIDEHYSLTASGGSTVPESGLHPSLRVVFSAGHSCRPRSRIGTMDALGVRSDGRFQRACIATVKGTHKLLCDEPPES